MIEFTERNNIGRDRFEFQMLYGINTQLLLSIASRGYEVLVATPFGPEWCLYLMRRLAERPANLLFVDPDAQQLTGISLWETKADREASAGGSGYYETAIADFAQLLTTPSVTTNVDVAVSDL